MDEIILQSARIAITDPIPHFLAPLLNCPAQEIKIQRTERGKPYLSDHSLEFNLSHSGELLLFVSAPARKVGVDIESTQMRPRWKDLARRFFAPDEVDKATSYENFFEIWTCKEATLKMLGTGIAGTLSEFSVLSPLCRLERISKFPGYVGAIAAEGFEPFKIVKINS